MPNWKIEETFSVRTIDEDEEVIEIMEDTEWKMNVLIYLNG
jgi:hypothetical protein